MSRGQKVWRSLAAKLCALVLIFIAVPVILYGQFRAADDVQRGLLLWVVQEQGRVVAEALATRLTAFKGTVNPASTADLARLRGAATRIKLLYRPSGSSAGFFLIATWPTLSKEKLATERQELISAGLLDRYVENCAGEAPLAIQYKGASGEGEILTSINPLSLPSGCWVVVTSWAATELVGAALAKPYWARPEVQLAALVYLGLAAIVLSLFASIWQSLGRFARQARRIRFGPGGEASFSSQNNVPELDGVAQEFDRLVQVLHGSAIAIRRAAEENAHAFKTPIATIRQSVEPLKRAGQADPKIARSAELIERATDRLDALVSAARRLDEAAAAAVSAPREKVALSRLVEDMVAGYREATPPGRVRLTPSVTPDIAVLGSSEAVEMVIENLLDNAISFSPPMGEIEIQLSGQDGYAELVVRDQGPGVEAADLERIFERYYSHRPSGTNGSAEALETHFGIGLWIVRRNVEALGGRVAARNRLKGGFEVRVIIPAAS